nr:regulatory protein RecX [Propionicicella superfundia]
MRDRSRSELGAAMARKDVPDEVARVVLDEFAERGYLDDARLAEGVVAGVAHRPRSRSALQRELTARGVDTETAQQATAAMDREAEVGAARRLAAKRAPSLSRLDHAVAYRRLAAALARRGFPADIVHQVTCETVQGERDGDEGDWATFGH